MTERIYRVFGIPGGFLAFVILLASCATVPLPRQADTQESLKGTASVYWKLRMEDKYKDTFEMEDKEALQKLSRKGKPLYESYVDRARAIKTTDIKSYSIKDATLEDHKGRVDVEFTFTLLEIPKPVHQVVSDEWVFRNEKWLHILQ